MTQSSAHRVVMYTTRLCPYYHAARALLQSKAIEFEDIAVDAKPALRAKMEQISGQHTVPQIWIGEQHIGGYTDLNALEQTGQLDRLLAG